MTLKANRIWEITTLDVHRQLLNEPAALLFLWFKWSGSARLAHQLVLDWHGRWHLYCLLPVVPLYLLDGECLPELEGWLGNTLHETGGYGSIYLIKRGEVALRVPSVADYGLTSLSKACDEIFAST